MATQDERLRQLYGNVAPAPNVNLGVEPLPAAPNAPPNLSDIMAKALIAGMQPAPTTTPVPTTTTVPQVSPTPAATPGAIPDFGALLAKTVGGGLEKAAIAMRKPEDAAAYANMATQQQAAQGMAATAAEDVRNNARIAGQVTAQEFPGQNPALFPQGLSKLLPSGGTLTAMPSGGYAASQTAAERAATVEARRKRFAAANYA